jgi:hypothetical protein
VSKQWGFLVDKDGKEFLNDGKAFASNLAEWKAAFGPDTRLKDLQDKIDAAINAEKWAEVVKLQKEKEELKKNPPSPSPFRKYKYVLDATIERFTVELAKAEGFASAPLYFIIEMKQGTLYYSEYDNVLKAEKIVAKTFEGGNYAFKVNVGKKLIKAAEMVLSEKDKKDLFVKNGINDADFEISALLMDFQNANISQYAKERTTIFDKIGGVDPNLITVLTVYFQHLAGTPDKPNPHPFILGYKVKERTDKLTPALFNPTAIIHSTTDTSMVLDKDKNRNDPQYQSFNYLMQIDNRPLPVNGTAGMLPFNLIEHKDDKSKTTSGVFAIDYNIFVEKYIVGVLEPQLYQQLANAMSKGLKDISAYTDGTRVECSKPDLNFTVKLANKYISPVTDQESKGIKISWDLTIEGKQHIEQKKSFGGTVASHMFISTSGKFKVVPEGKKEKDVEAARPGKLEIVLTAAKNGTLAMTSSFSQPYIGTTTKDPIRDDGSFSWRDLLDIVLNFVPVVNIVNAIVTMFTDFSFKIDLQSADFKNFQIGDFENFTNRVILPGSNTFTYKTVRLLNGSKNEDDAVLFDIAYAPYED